MLAASSMLCDEGDDDENDSKVQFIKKREPRSKLKIPTYSKSSNRILLYFQRTKNLKGTDGAF